MAPFSVGDRVFDVFFCVFGPTIAFGITRYSVKNMLKIFDTIIGIVLDLLTTTAIVLLGFSILPE